MLRMGAQFNTGTVSTGVESVQYMLKRLTSLSGYRRLML